MSLWHLAYLYFMFYNGRLPMPGEKYVLGVRSSYAHGVCSSSRIWAERYEDMRIDFWTVALIALILGGSGYWFYKNNAKKKEAARIAYQMQVEKEERAKAEEEARIRKEQEEKAEKDKTLKMLQGFIAREEKNLKKIIEEHRIILEGIEDDKELLTEALTAVEKEAKEADERSRKRGQTRYSNAERVLLILKNEDINNLAKKHLGEDFSAMRAEYQDRVNTALRLHQEQTKRLKASRDKYHKSVAGLDEEVEKKKEVASRKILDSHTLIGNKLDQLLKKKEKIEGRIKRMETAMVSNRRREKEAAELKRQLQSLEKEIETAQERYALAKSQVAHLDVTVAETSVRRKYDTALKINLTEESDIHKDIQHKSNIFHVATEYENRSLDMIRNALKGRSDILVKAINDAESKLNFMRSTSANMDFLNSRDLEKVREKIAKKLSEGVDVNMSNK